MGGVNCQAQTVTTATDDQTDVTIVTTAENQIGVKKTDDWGNVSYDFASGLTTEQQTLLTKATKLTIKGKVSNIDMMVLFNKQPQSQNTNTQLTYLDLSEATFSQFDIAKEGDGYHWTFMPNGYTHWNGVTYLALPKPCVGQTELPGYPLNEDGTVASYTNFKAVFGGLKTVIIPEGYTSIGTHAFDGCVNISSVTLPEGLTTIGSYAFYLNKSLHSITFPESLERVEEYAFSLADLQGAILFPQNVKYLGLSSFAGQQSESVTDVYFQSRVSPVTEEGVFGSGQYAGYSGFVNPGGTTATRENYYSNGHKFCILHFRPDLTQDEFKTYWDNTRVYTYKDLYLGDERMWPTHEEFVKAHNNIYYQGTTDTKGSSDPIHFDGTNLDEEELKHIGILRFTLGRADAPIPGDGPEISDDDWWTICIPYTLTKEEVMKIFGDGTQLYGLKKVTRDYNSNKIRLSFTFNVFNEDGSARQPESTEFTGTTLPGGKLTAWWPYMIKPGKKLDTTEEGAKYLKFTTRIPDAGSEISDIIPATLVKSTEAEGTEWRYIFRGNCSGTSTASDGTTTGVVYHRPDYCYFLGWDTSLRDGKGAPAFYYQHAPSTKKVWTHYTCTVIPVKHTEASGTSSDATGIDDSFSGSTDTSAKTLSFFGTDDDTDPTAIGEIEFITPDKATDGDIYTVQGTLVRKNALSTEGLAKGIYVCNGKKFIVK